MNQSFYFGNRFTNTGAHDPTRGLKKVITLSKEAVKIMRKELKLKRKDRLPEFRSFNKFFDRYGRIKRGVLKTIYC